ncbi:Rab proteins geranylgeranyltransferase component A [Gnomoniopsis sp. IMI 355080]|nr:Rab proteins geranylgeranyltransferase component A [Gnomoniopsis sp. IMI 355080]
MESLSETTWDVIICSTSLQQSLLALALSRSDKKILHIDPNDYYGGCEAAFSLNEADAWATEIAHASLSSSSSSVFAAAAVTKPTEEASAISNARACALSLSPQLIHANSTLLSQLVSSRAYRQLEFLAVGSFFVLKPAAADGASTSPTLARIPSTREDVFSSSDLSARAKRQLMKFLKLVLSYEEEEARPQWQEYAERPLADFLGEKMGLDYELRTYITALTLSLDGQISTKKGLGTIHRHLTSMGLFGPGFAAVYPKWGGGSEIAQVACRAGAVGGGIYMLGTGIKTLKSEGQNEELVEVELSDGTVVKAKTLIRGPEQASPTVDLATEPSVNTVSRLITVVDSPLTSLFVTNVEGAPTPAVAVIALPPGSVTTSDGTESKYPIYVMAHSSETGECPAGQKKPGVLYLSTIHTSESRSLLDRAVAAVLAALVTLQDSGVPQSLYQLYYEQRSGVNNTVTSEGRIHSFPTPPVSLTFDDDILGPVQQVWQKVMPEAAEDENIQYMIFADREGVGDEDD